jgi:chemotaxis protein methyltransferase CheR
VQRGLSVLQMMRCFTDEEGQQWRIDKSLRDAVRFEQRSLMDAPPRPGRFDIVLCRNVLMYFSPDVRTAAFRRLAEASAPDGCLMLGAGETIIGLSDEFVIDPDLRGLYVRAAAAGVPQPLARRA